ncbi:MAG: hypothetical protein ACK4R7_00855 [Fervidobacterium sp.]
MVTVIINGEKSTHTASDFENFGDFLKKLLPEGKVLKSLKINEKDIPISFVEELRNAKIDEEILIEIEAVNTIDFLKDTLNDVLGYINTVKNMLNQVSSNVIFGNESGWKAVKDLSDGIAAMENLRNSTQQITKLSEEELDLSIKFGEVVEILRLLLNSLNSHDNVEAADLIEHKIPVVLDYYIEYFTKVLEALNKIN